MFWRGREPHDGTTPAAPMPTRFDFPCGRDFYDFSCKEESCFREPCAPPNFNEYWWSTVGYYSPAICPSGYTVGCSRFDSQQGPSVEPTETAVQCVPVGFTCTDNPSIAFSATAKAVMLQIRWAESDLTNLETHPLTPDHSVTKVGGQVTMEDLRVRQGSFGSFDNPTTSLSSITSKGSASTTSPNKSTRSLPSHISGSALGSEPSTLDSPTTPSGPHSPTTPSSSHSPTTSSGSDSPTVVPAPVKTGKLSTAAGIGIGVGISAAVLLLAVLGWYIWRYRKKRLSKTGEGAMPHEPELDGQARAELDGRGRSAETTGVGNVPGLASNVAAVELDNDGKKVNLGTGHNITMPPSEVAGDPRGYQTGTPTAPVPELAAYPYQRGEVQGQNQNQNQHGEHSQYGPYAHQAYPQQGQVSSVASQSPLPQYQSPQSYNAQLWQPSQDGQSPGSSVPQQHQQQYGPVPSSALEMTDINQSPVSSPAQQEPVWQPEPSAAELSQLMEEHEQLEQQRQRLLQLEQIEQQQAALRERIAAARGTRSPGSTGSGAGSATG